MVFSTLLFASKKDDITHEEFKDRNENGQIPLVRSLAGDLFPIEHITRYIGRTTEKASDTSHEGAAAPQGADERSAKAQDLLSGSQPSGTPLILQGKPEDINWDVMAELNFADEEHFKKFVGVFTDEANAKKVHDSEDTFIDRSSIRYLILGDVTVVKNDKYKG